MIRTAISELNEESGSTQELISEFIKREYDDLPWAHGSILGLQLGKLCEDGELARAEGGRYVLRDSIDAEAETEQCEDRNGETEREEEGIEQEMCELDIGGSSRVVEYTQEQGEQHQPHTQSIEESEKEGLPKCIPITGIVIDLLLGPLDAAAKMSCSLNVEEYMEQNGNETKHHGRGGAGKRPPKLNANAIYEKQSLQQDQAQQRGRGRGPIQDTNKYGAWLQQVQVQPQQVRGRNDNI